MEKRFMNLLSKLNQHQLLYDLGRKRYARKLETYDRRLHRVCERNLGTALTSMDSLEGSYCFKSRHSYMM
jgi:hypothetical protein